MAAAQFEQWRGDWNDCMVALGDKAARQRFRAQLQEQLTATVPAVSSPPPTSEPRDHAPGGEGEAPQQVRFCLADLLDHFCLVYGSDMVWDGVNRVYMRLSHLRHAVGRELFKLWESSSERRIIYGLRFEPGEDLGPLYVNLWDGFAMEPGPVGAAGCARILDHFYRLCSHRVDLFNWLMCWVAYPIQNPGAKMDSSVVMHGAEGPGKSAVWEKVVMPIYGEYASTIGQAQLESQFTGWQASKLFALAEEVVSRAEKSHYKGQLKQMVTGKTLRINEKNLPERVETNHVNFVFLSNETVPLLLDQGDRRYLVLYADDVPGEEYFRLLHEEIYNGGVAAFFRYLLDLDLSGFGTWSKPPMNTEKETLVEMGMSTALYFHKQWRDGDLGLPYGAARSADLWLVFVRWCERNNEYKRRQRDLAADLRRVMKPERRDIAWPAQFSPKKTARMWVPPEVYKGRDMPGYADEVGRQCRDFLMAAQSEWLPEGYANAA